MAVLLLDSTYEPLKIIGWKRAAYLVFSGKAEVVEESEIELRSPSIVWKLPSVIRQFGRFRRRAEVKFSRINIYMRDGWTCQYCGKRKATKDLTFDHVVPRSAGGKTSWTNIVTACRPCNSEKDSKTPKQAGMKLLKNPVRPKWLPAQIVIKIKTIPKEWGSYIDLESFQYWTIELESE